MNLFPIWVCLPPGNAFPYSLTWGLKFYKLTVLLTRSFKHLMFMRIQGHLRNEFEHMDELNLKTHAHTERGRERLGSASCRECTELLTYAFGLAAFIVFNRILGWRIPLWFNYLLRGGGRKKEREKKGNPFPNGHNLGYFCSVVKSLLSLLINISSFPMVGLCILSHKNNWSMPQS